MDKFHEMKEKITTQLGILAEQPVENSTQGIHDALERVMREGSCGDKAKAIMMVGQWMWAHCEEWYHSSQPAAVK